MHDFVKNNLPPGFQTHWTLNANVRPRLNLRNDFHIKEPFPRFLYLLDHPFLRLPRTWNKIPSNIKNIESKVNFTKHYKRHLINL